MKLLTFFLSVCFAQNNFDFNLNEVRIHLQYKGGVKALVTDLFKDYGYPDVFIKMFDDTTDESIIESFSTVSFGPLIRLILI